MKRCNFPLVLFSLLRIGFYKSEKGKWKRKVWLTFILLFSLLLSLQFILTLTTENGIVCKPQINWTYWMRWPIFSSLFLAMCSDKAPNVLQWIQVVLGNILCVSCFSEVILSLNLIMLIPELNTNSITKIKRRGNKVCLFLIFWKLGFFYFILFFE